ncbi:Ca-activated chloride channel family protein [Streptomyces sp. PanSC19]|uniref:vWA domain-containing protein n=1 Tax=Streptomyces sp. PanSC19 TaxID=1520455 RepID=UPI000F4AA19D|nr:von Willebrand factor type A domain-containing protein [Streptomyces sp. PanSC19]ROQ32443.1 Ca-activated chloride channel family protein [Streptomyces sp. PanSC19]
MEHRNGRQDEHRNGRQGEHRNGRQGERQREGRGPRRGTRFPAVVAALLAAGLAVGGCSAGGTDRTGARDLKEGGTVPDGGRAGTAAPREGEQRSPTPAPDYLSTFALDVDTASYGYARRTLAEGRLPDPATVRPEEFVNSFRPDYPRPKDNGFSVTLDGARTGADGWSLLRVGLATRGADRNAERPPAALTFVVDVSGSMDEPGRLDLVKESLGLLADQLRDDDSIALVTFSDEAETRLPMTRVGGARDRIHEVVGSLATSSSTNVGAGVRTGYDVAVEGHRKGATNRVVLLSDALANTGDTEADPILARIEEERREYGITLFGVGVGSEYGDAFMERLADKGDGQTTYVSTPAQARKVFVDQLPSHVELRARDAKAQVAFDRRTVERFRLIGYENRAVADDDFRNDRVDGGEIGAGHTVTALYAVKTRPGATGPLATATVRWLDPATRAPHERSGTLGATALTGDVWGDGHDSLQLTAIAAYFADALRRGDLPGAPGLPALAKHAGAIADRSGSAVVTELADAIRKASGLLGPGQEEGPSREGELKSGDPYS